MFSSIAVKQLQFLLPGYLLQMCYGMNTAFTAIMTPQLMENQTEFSISENEESWIVCIDNFIVLFMSILSGVLQTKYGPMRMLQLTCVPYAIGWIIACFASNVWLIYLSRLFVGASHAMLTTSIYAIEITTTEMRAALNFFEGVPRCLGSITVYVLAMYLRWQQIAYFSWIVPVLALVGLQFCPESPVFLINQGNQSKSYDVLRKLNGNDETSARENLDHLMSTNSKLQVKNKESNHGSSTSDILWNMRSYKQFLTRKELYRPLFLLTLLTVIQQFSGMTVIRSYVVKIFKNLRKADEDDSIGNDAYICAIVLTIVRMSASMILSKLSMTLKRRTVYFLSAGLTVISLSFVGTCIYFIQRNVMDQIDASFLFWMTLLSSCFLAFSVQMGVQTMPHLLSGVLYPKDLRAKGKSISRAITCILIMITLKLYLPLKNAITEYGVFFFFAGVTMMLVPLIYFKSLFKNQDNEKQSSNWFYLPETKNIPLEDIQYLFIKRT